MSALRLHATAWAAAMERDLCAFPSYRLRPLTMFRSNTRSDHTYDHHCCAELSWAGPEAAWRRDNVISDVLLPEIAGRLAQFSRAHARAGVVITVTGFLAEGPMLASELYGEAALRAYDDSDIAARRGRHRCLVGRWRRSGRAWSPPVAGP
jgi:hypothetical protein